MPRAELIAELQSWDAKFKKAVADKQYELDCEISNLAINNSKLNIYEERTKKELLKKYKDADTAEEIARLYISLPSHCIPFFSDSQLIDIHIKIKKNRCEYKKLVKELKELL